MLLWYYLCEVFVHALVVVDARAIFYEADFVLAMPTFSNQLGQKLSILVQTTELQKQDFAEHRS